MDTADVDRRVARRYHDRPRSIGVERMLVSSEADLLGFGSMHILVSILRAFLFWVFFITSCEMPWHGE
jgi:hypothetical protein